MGVSAAVGVGVLITGATVYTADQQAKTAKAATDQQQKNINAQLDQANQQKQIAQNQSASTTASAQARVRAMANANPDGSTIMTPVTPTSSGSGPAIGKTILGS